MKLLDARWFRVLAIFVLLLVLLGLNLNRLIVLIDKRYYEPTYRGCITVMGWIAEDVTQLERQIVCNITMVRIIIEVNISTEITISKAIVYSIKIYTLSKISKILFNISNHLIN